jgi:hypothetical protein
MQGWGATSYVPCTMPALQVVRAALREDRRRLDILSAFLQRNGQELECAGQGYFSVLPHEVHAAALHAMCACACAHVDVEVVLCRWWSPY